jgi:glycosyltransferase involved in cell wall biosynthesis
MVDHKRVLFITNSSSIGGAQQCLLDLILSLPERIKPVIIVSKEGPFLNIIKQNNIEYYIIPFRGWWYSRFRIKFIERLFNNLISIIRIYIKIKNLDIRLVYSNTLYSPIGGILSAILRLPHIWHIHEFPHLNEIQKFDFGLNWSMSFVNKNSNFVICPSLALKQALTFYITENKIICIHNGVVCNNDKQFSRKNFQSSINNNITILIIGSIIEFKGQHDAILAIEQLIKKGKKVNLIILGEGDTDYVNDLKFKTKVLEIENNISWEGFKSDVYTYLSKADLLYVCSKFESFGMVIVEAMSVGCPVIATKTGGIPEIIINGYNGMLYDIGDVESLVDKTIKLIENKDLYQEISKNSITTCNNYFDLEDYSEKIIKKIDFLV